MSSLTRMTSAMFEIPFRMFELPFVMSAAFMDAIVSASDTTDIARQTGVSKHRMRKGTLGTAKRGPRVRVISHERHAA